MRRLAFLPLLGALVLACAPAAAGAELRSLSASDWLQLNGRGVAKLSSAGGGAWGNLGLGRIVVTDVIGDGVVTNARVLYSERRTHPAPGVTVYFNTEGRMRFLVEFGRWRLTIAGRSVNASAALNGRAVLSMGRPRSTYRINQGDARRWPWAPRTVLN